MGRIRPTCEHKDAIVNEYISEGENLIGEMVRARMKSLACIYCGQMQIKLIQTLSSNEDYQTEII